MAEGGRGVRHRPAGFHWKFSLEVDSKLLLLAKARSLYDAFEAGSLAR